MIFVQFKISTTMILVGQLIVRSMRLVFRTKSTLNHGVLRLVLIFKKINDICITIL